MGIYSSAYALTWKAKGTKFNRFVFQLAPRERRTGGTAGGLLATARASAAMAYGKPTEDHHSRLEDQISSLLPTPRAGSPTGQCIHGEGGMDLQTRISSMILPTPTARDKNGANALEHLLDGKARETHANQLPNVIKLLGTPLANDGKRSGKGKPAAERGLNGTPLVEAIGQSPGLKLQPGFVEWMMGYPPGWTDPAPIDSKP